MAAEDFAILMGISLYADPLYPRLGGPGHDVALMKDWLMSEDGGAVPEDRITTIVSPTQFPAGQDPLMAPPLPLEFETKFVKLERERAKLKEARVNNRLYLYFSGHGFSSRDIVRGAEGALYAANAAKDYYPHVYGTYFASRAVQKALFKEIVLIMDCCRDAEANRAPIVPALPNTPDFDMAADVRVLQIYAVPRGGKAYEREIKERANTVHGLLTHALIKAFEEARPTGDGKITATRLRDHLAVSWATVCGGDDGPPIPEVYLPKVEMFFAAKNRGVSVQFSFAAPQPAGSVLVLRDAGFKKFASLAADGNAGDDIVSADAPVLQYDRDGTTIRLRMLPGFYQYRLTGNPPTQNQFKVESGDVRVDL